MSGVFETLGLPRWGRSVVMIGALVVSGLTGCSNQQVAEKPAAAEVKRSQSARSSVATPERLSYA
ncbi:MAG: hypothetical protein WBL07_12895, partial [Thiothrix litoralis]|uniref:hypothetical protein n=1 Tax=Thiothrix litoralis TaxID=2891210 RepID=UPI003C76D641